ncbi:MAG: hypothetical protein Q4C64_03505 [Erysipelotrichia bacterium]|nr:hypothetical protein [Erysipelotrichia bacterium]
MEFKEDKEYNLCLSKAKKLCGYNLIVTSEIKLSEEDIYSTYHNLWRIEESFRIMKSELDARPVFLKTEATVHGYFLICYLVTVLVRLLQIYELNDEDSFQQLFNFFRNYTAAKVGNKYLNLAVKSEFITKLSALTNLPLNNAIFTEKQYKKIMDYHW